MLSCVLNNLIQVGGIVCIVFDAVPSCWSELNSTAEFVRYDVSDNPMSSSLLGKIVLRPLKISDH